MTEVSKYGLDAFILSAPFSLIVSLLLVAGCGLVGYFLLHVIPDAKALIASSDRLLAAPSIGCAGIAVILYPLLLYNVVGRATITSLAFLLAGLGAVAALIAVYDTTRVGWRIAPLSTIRRESTLTILLLVTFGIVAASPVTSGDALIYHVGVATEILNTGEMPVFPQWALGRLGSSGELLIAVGLSVGAEQFGSLIEYCGLLAIYAAIGTAARSAKQIPESEELRFIRLCAISLPVYLFLASTPKPQLLPVGLNVFAFALAMAADYSSKVEYARIRRIFFVVCMLLLASIPMKFNFILSSSLIGIYALWIAGRKDLREAGTCFGIAILLLLVLFLPLQWWKHTHYGGALLSTFVAPLVGDVPGDAAFLNMLRTYTDSSDGFFPLNIVLPFTGSGVSMVLGISPAIILFYGKNLAAKRARPVLALLLAQVLVGALLGQRTGRFFAEPVLWLLVFLSTLTLPIGARFRSFRLAIVLQSIGVLVAAVYGALQLFPGSMDRNARTHIMREHADGYVLGDWIDKQLPQGAIVLSNHGALSVIPRKTIYMDWLGRLSADDQAGLRYHSDLVKASGASHILLVGDDYRAALADCLGTPLAKESALYRPAGRNPFVERGGFKSVALYQLDASRLPGCVNLSLERP
jgi:hypothetical protein